MVLSCAVLATRTQQSGATLCPYHRTSTVENSGRHTHNAKNIASIGFSNNNKLPTHRQKEIFRSETSKIDTKTRLRTSTARYFERARVTLRMLKWVLFYTGSEVRAQYNYVLGRAHFLQNVTHCLGDRERDYKLSHNYFRLCFLSVQSRSQNMCPTYIATC